MGEFKLKCPKNYPILCNLLTSDREALKRSEKYKGFLMYQFENQDEYSIETIKSYFKTPTYYLYDAKEESGLGIKTCKICRLALASDFGVGVLTPQNSNVFFECGIELGLGKPLIYIVNENIERASNLPFDLTDQVVITHTSREELFTKLGNEVPPFIEKVLLSTAVEEHRREFIEGKIRGLDATTTELLRYFILERAKIPEPYVKATTGGAHPSREQQLSNLFKLGFIKLDIEQHSGGPHFRYWSLVEPYRPPLEEMLFKET